MICIRGQSIRLILYRQLFYGVKHAYTVVERRLEEEQVPYRGRLHRKGGIHRDMQHYQSHIITLIKAQHYIILNIVLPINKSSEYFVNWPLQ